MMLRCECGKALRVPNDAVGKRVQCPACRGVLTAPAEDFIPVAEVVAAPEPPPAFEVVPDEPPVSHVVSPARPRGKRSAGKREDEPESSARLRKKGDKPAEPPIPPWAWVFAGVCIIIPLITRGGAIPGAIGACGGGACLAVSRDTSKSLAGRVAVCVLVVVLCWLLFLSVV